MRNHNSHISGKEDAKCAPDKTYHEGSCYTTDQLVKIASIYNEALKENKIQNKKIKIKSISIQNDRKYLLREITDRLSNVCKNQICWIKQRFIKKLSNVDFYKDLKKSFRPAGPEGKFEWLSTTHINDVMEQYERKYGNFKFFGAIPIDFDNLTYLGIKDINFDKFAGGGKTKLGFVFNLDEHWQQGSHWVSLFADLKKSQIYFFDSYGIKPEKRIKRLVKRIAQWCYKRNHCNMNDCSVDSVNSDSFMKGGKNKNKMEKKLRVDYNRNRHQYKNSECGVYSLNFILRLLNGNSFQDITSKKVLDDEINKCRDTYFHFKEGKNPIKK
jgi:hypothetical protein